MTSRRRFLKGGLALAAGSILSPRLVWGDATLERSTPFSPEGLFSRAMEGPATAPDGSIYVANFGKRGTIGKVSPTGEASLFLTLPEGSVANGAQISQSGMLYLADYRGHNILKVDLATKAISVHCHEPKMHQPNDLALAKDGTLYASDPDWKGGKGQLWRIDPDGKAHLLLKAGLITPNGIALTPDESSLIISETKPRRVRSFALKQGKLAKEGHTIKTFKEGELDGLRVDGRGQIHVTRPLKGRVSVLSPTGELIREIHTSGDVPTNLTFGGKGGKTAFVCVADKGRLESYLL